MKWKIMILIIGVMMMISLVSSADTIAEEDTGLFTWIWNGINQLWEKWFGGEVIETSIDNPINNTQSGIVLSANVFGGWTYYITGNESVLYDVKSLTKDKICIIPKDIEMKDIIQNESKLEITLDKGVETEKITYELVTYKYPKDIKMYDIKDMKTELITKDLKLDKQIDNSICFDLNNSKSMLYKLGEESIVISGLSNYASTNTNVTQENLFTHLNLTDGSLVLYMPFDVQEDSANKTYDYSNGSFDGILKGGTSVIHPIFNSSGKFGANYKFDGSNDYIDITFQNYTTTGKSFTVVFWFKADGIVANFNCLFESTENSNHRFAITLDGWNNSVVGALYDGSSYIGTARTDTSSILKNVYYMITYTYNGTNGYMYLNGTLRPFTDGDVNTGATKRTVLGARSDLSAGKFFNGSIDEVMIFNRVLSAVEIAQIYNATYPRFYPVGEMNFTANNFGTNNTVNITIQNCQQYNGSLINFKVNDGSYSQLNSSCMFDNYNMTGDLTSASVVLQLNSTNNYFYSPVINGNITLNSWFEGGATPPANCWSYDPATKMTSIPVGCMYGSLGWKI